MPRSSRLIRPWGPPWLRVVALLLGILYPALVIGDTAVPRVTASIVPRPLLYFAQVAALFPRASIYTIEFRAQGWFCDQKRFEEIDLRPYFPIHADDKENQFSRAMFFYLENRPVMHAIDDYITFGFDRDHAERIGGVRLLSLREPIPKPGTDFPLFRRRPLAEIPKREWKFWYWTPISKRKQRCAGDDTPWQ